MSWARASRELCGLHGACEVNRSQAITVRFSSLRPGYRERVRRRVGLTVLAAAFCPGLCAQSFRRSRIVALIGSREATTSELRMIPATVRPIFLNLSIRFSGTCNELDLAKPFKFFEPQT